VTNIRLLWKCPFRLQRYSFIATLFLGPFDDVITKFYCICLLLSPSSSAESFVVYRGIPDTKYQQGDRMENNMVGKSHTTHGNDMKYVYNILAVRF
jgi:hypothetical protein